MTETTDAVGAAIAGELSLMSAEVRASRSRVQGLLDPDFVEVGVSGRRWNRREMVAELAGLPGGSKDGPHYAPMGLTGVELAPGLVHLTYETVLDGERAHRSSLWRRRTDGTGWRMYYHQATPIPAGASTGGAPVSGDPPATHG